MLLESITFLNPILSTCEQESFIKTITFASESLLNYSDDADAVSADADELEKINQYLRSSQISTLAEQFRDRATEIQEDNDDSEKNDSTHNDYKAKNSESFDVDALFSGLLDR